MKWLHHRNSNFAKIFRLFFRKLYQHSIFKGSLPLLSNKQQGKDCLLFVRFPGVIGWPLLQREWIWWILVWSSNTTFNFILLETKACSSYTWPVSGEMQSKPHHLEPKQSLSPNWIRIHTRHMAASGWGKWYQLWDRWAHESPSGILEPCSETPVVHVCGCVGRRYSKCTWKLKH